MRWSAGSRRLLLCLLRFGQGFGLGGEWGGAALLAVENAPQGWEARFGAAPQLGAPVGFLAANGLFLLLGLLLERSRFHRLGLAHAVPGERGAGRASGLWVRLRIGETPAFRAALEREPPPAVPARPAARRSSGRACSAGQRRRRSRRFAIFYLATAFALTQATGPFGYPRGTFLAIQLGANLILCARHRPRRGPQRSDDAREDAFRRGAGDGGDWFHLRAGPRRGVAVPGRRHAVRHAVRHGLRQRTARRLAADAVSGAVRYSGISVAFNAGGIVGGAVTPIAAQLMSTASAAAYTGLLLTAAGLLTFAGVRLSRPTDPLGSRSSHKQERPMTRRTRSTSHL